MPIDLTKIPELLIDAVETGNLVPFVGAGVSRHAKTKDGKGFPTWTEFLQELVDMACRSEWLTPEEEQQIDKLVKRGKYLMAAQALKNVIPEDQLDVYIRKRFDTSNVEVGAIHRALFKLKSPLILTTNYDQLLEKAYALEFGDTATWYTHKHAPHVQQYLKSHHHGHTKPMIFKIHGTAERPSEIIFAEMDYRKLIYGQPGYRAIISAVFVTKVVLMLGFSFSDPELTVIAESLREWLEKRTSPDYILLPKGEKGKIEKTRLRQDFGLEVIEYEPSKEDDGRELLELVEYLARFVPEVSSRGRGNAT
jgi:hypothetical protein